jgi:hypothetical protein
MLDVLLQTIANLPFDPYARRRIAMVSGKDDLTDEEVAFIQDEFHKIIASSLVHDIDPPQSIDDQDNTAK